MTKEVKNLARSKAKKVRLKRMREGRSNPEELRGSWGGINPIERRTPTRKERLERQWNKHRKRWDSSEARDPIVFWGERGAFSSYLSHV